MDFKTCALVASIRDGMQSAINAKIRGKEWNSYQNYIFDLALNLINNGNKLVKEMASLIYSFKFDDMM